MSVRQTPLICSGHSRPVPDLAYSAITNDGFYIISGCLDGKAMLRNGETGDWIGTFEGHKGAVWCARVNADATLALTGSADYTAKLWDALTGSELRTFTHNRIVKAVDISHDSRQAVTGGQEKVLRVWDTEKGVCTATLSGHQSIVRQVMWAGPNAEGGGDNLILSGGADEAIRMWDLRSLTQVKSCSAKAPVASMELSKDGKYLTTAAGKEVTFWDASTLFPLKVYTVGVELNSASLHPSSTKFVAGGSDFYVHVYDFPTGEELEVHKGHHGPVHCIRFSPDGGTYASGSEDGTIRIWQSSPKNYGLWQITNANNTSNATNGNGNGTPINGSHQHPPSSTPPKR